MFLALLWHRIKVNTLDQKMKPFIDAKSWTGCHVETLVLVEQAVKRSTAALTNSATIQMKVGQLHMTVLVGSP